jgi:glycosyltransferase involved in cell wall biosynthesis
VRLPLCVQFKKRIYFVATGDVSINAFLLNHLKALSEYFDVTVIVNTDDPDFLFKQGINVKVIPLSISRNVHILSDIFSLSRLISIFIKYHPSAVHSITPKAGLLAMLAASIARVPFRVHTFTGQVWATKDGLTRLMLKSFDRLIARLATFNIVDSPSQQQFLIDEKVLCKSNSVVFGLGSVSGVDLKRFKPSKKIFNDVRQELLIPQDAFVFTYLGRLNKDKGVLDLAQAFSKIKDSNAYLLIVGPDEGGFVDEIKKINAHKLEQIRFVGFTKVPEQYLAASNALCLPSYREGFGSVIIEAAAIGVPAIASNIYGISDALVNNETGLLHIAADINSILDCLSTFLNDPKLVKKYGDTSKLRAVKDFDANLITAHWVDFYKRISPSAS